MKRSMILVVASSLLAPGPGSLLAEKGGGKMGGAGLGTTAPPVAGKASGGERETGRHTGAASAAPSAMGSGNMNASTRLASNPALSRRIQPLLPAGLNVATAAAGFRNQGQFIAALHVSRNLGIPFDQLKAKMTGSNPESLGQAIHDLRPSLTRSTVRKDRHAAERQAELDMDAARLANQLSTNATLAGRAQALLPAGTNLQTAAAGFDNARQFLLVAHVAHDLNIPFAQLKAKVTGSNPVSLAQAVGMLNSSLGAGTVKSDLKVARLEAKADLQAADVPANDDRKEIAAR